MILLDSLSVLSPGLCDLWAAVLWFPSSHGRFRSEARATTSARASVPYEVVGQSELILVAASPPTNHRRRAVDCSAISQRSCIHRQMGVEQCLFTRRPEALINRNRPHYPHTKRLYLSLASSSLRRQRRGAQD